MNAEKSFTKLPVWTEAIELVKQVNQLADLFPKSELAGITHLVKSNLANLPVSLALGFKPAAGDERPGHIQKAQATIETLEVLLQVAYELEYVNEKKLSKVLEKTADLALTIKQVNARIEKDLKK